VSGQSIPSSEFAPTQQGSPASSELATISTLFTGFDKTFPYFPSIRPTFSTKFSYLADLENVSFPPISPLFPDVLETPVHLPTSSMSKHSSSSDSEQEHTPLPEFAGICPTYIPSDGWDALHTLIDQNKAFDPGICPLEDILLFHMQTPFDSKAMHRAGTAQVPGAEPLVIESVLFDSGANERNYVGRDWVQKHATALSRFLRPIKSGVRLGDSKTICKIEHAITLTISFVDSRLKTHTATADFEVLNTNCEMIIGLPLIASQLHGYFLTMVQDLVPSLPRASFSDTDFDDRFRQHNTGIPEVDYDLSALDGVFGPAEFVPGQLYPLLDRDLEEAPEDVDFGNPSSFTNALYYFEKTQEELTAAFHSQLESQVNSDFAKATPIFELLRSAKGQRVFAEVGWHGLNHFPPLELDWSEDMPSSIKPRAKYYNHRTLTLGRPEWERMLGYFYTASDSPWASNTIMAPKKTPTGPGIRIAGEYNIEINKHLKPCLFPIPHVQSELGKASGFVCFADFDMTNSFHQRELAFMTSQKLSIVCYDGQYRPLFMPEGIMPASQILQSMIRVIFKGFEEWSIIIFDNILILGHDYPDLYEKIEKILDRCIDYNVKLKFLKSWLGFSEARFFGYLVNKDGYKMTPEREAAIMSIPFPNTVKRLRQFIGKSGFFRDVTPKFAEVMAPFNDMTVKGFSFNKSTWSVDYETLFIEVKKLITQSLMVYFPKYELEWIMRCDASDLGCAAVLLQLVPDAGEVPAFLQVISLVSHKLSKAAVRWTVIEKEYYSLILGLKAFERLIFHKLIIIETDHRNSVFINASVVPKIVRWRMFAQAFNTIVRHLEGKKNTSDWISRIFRLESADAFNQLERFAREDLGIQDFDESYSMTFLDMLSYALSRDHYEHEAFPCERVEVDETGAEHTVMFNLVHQESSAADINADVMEQLLTLTPDEALDAVHGGRMGHMGACRTWLLLRKYMPGHNIPFAYVSEFVRSCVTCQKNRVGHRTALKPLQRVIHPEHHRSQIGIDILSISPTDQEGNVCIAVIMNLTSKLVSLYVQKSHSAMALATSIFSHWARFGGFDEIVSDPGSDLTSEVVEQLSLFLGSTRKYSLVNRHESNGIERVGQETLRHLLALVADLRVAHRWGAPDILLMVEYLINSAVHSETGITPFDATFGRQDSTYFRLPQGLEPNERMHAYVKLLDDNLSLLREVSSAHSSAIKEKRLAQTSETLQNKYCAGDFILFLPDEKEVKLSKYKGPYEVHAQYKNDITCKHLVQGTVHVFHVDKVKIFFGDREKAFAAAQLDHDQYVMTRFMAFKGSPDKRTTMEFKIEFVDGTITWLPWSEDIYSTILYEEYCNSITFLKPLTMRLEKAVIYIRELKSKAISTVVPSDVCFVDIRFWGSDWAYALELPDFDSTQYLVQAVYKRFVSTSKKTIVVNFPLFKQSLTVDNYWVTAYGSIRALPVASQLVDLTLARSFPKVLEN
jgi:hypothetical protein